MKRPSRAALIESALAEIYSASGKVTPTIRALAADLDLRWEDLGERGDRGLEHEVMLVIWNWFPGGGTAEIAAMRVLGTVGKGSS